MPVTAGGSLTWRSLSSRAVPGAPYIRLLSIRAVRQPLVGVIIGRLPIAATSLAVILMVRGETGSFAVAGAVDASMAIATAVSLPVEGRLVDRFGQTAVLVPCCIVNPIALACLVLAAKSGGSAIVLCGIAAVCGAAIPPLGPSLRTLWSSLVSDEKLRQTAFALDAVLVETAFIIGPLLTALVVSAASPAAAVGANAAFAGMGTAIFASSRASRAWRGTSSGHGWLGAVANRAMLSLLAVELAIGAAIGAMELSTTAFATQYGSPSTSGALIAVQAAASMAGGLWYGSSHRETRAAERFPRTCLALAIGFAPLPLAGSIGGLFPLMLLSGFAFAPSSAAVFALIDEIVPPGTATEASSWVTTALITGVAIGSGVGGAVVGGGHADAGYVLAAGAAVAAALIAGASRQAWLGVPLRERLFDP
jgi:MFS family permease